MKPIRQARRNAFQKYFSDPLVAGIAFLFWEFLKLLPMRLACACGAGLGSFAGFLMWRRNHIGMVNLRIAFPEKTEEERRAILRKMWLHWGRFYAEMPHAMQLYRQATVIGLDRLKESVRLGKGGIICSAHLGNWELSVSGPLFDDFCLNPVYRRANNPWLEKLLFQRRKGILIPKGVAGARRIIEVLHNKGFIAILCDQKLREGIPVPFFGQPAMTAPAVAVIALKLRVPIMMARSIRQPDGHFLVEVSEPLKLPVDMETDKAVYQIMLTINRQIESWIRENPEQWLWIHRRFDKKLYR